MLTQGNDDKVKSTEKGPRGAAWVRFPSPYSIIPLNGKSNALTAKNAGDTIALYAGMMELADMRDLGVVTLVKVFERYG